MKKYLILVCIFLFGNSFAQTYNPTIQTWIIDAETTSCGSIDGGECLLFKIQGKKEFEILNEKIEGFEYEKGNTYTISVKQEIKQPPIAAGESVFKYVLVKVISKKELNTFNNSSYSTISSQHKIFEVNFETVPCESDNSKSCLLIREKGRKEFEILNGTIYGFNYENGYSYQIVVKPTANGNYYFVNEISKKFIQISNSKYQPLENKPLPQEISTSTNRNGKIIGKSNIQTSSTLDKKWYLRKMKETESSSFITDDNIMWIELNTFNNQLKGFGACNNFEAVLRTDLSSTFQIDKLTSGYVTCGNKKMENLFYTLLQQADGFEIKNGNLILSKRWNYLLEFVSNQDNKEEITSTYTPPTIIKNEQSTYATNETITTTTKLDEKQQPVTTTVTTKETTISGDAEAEEMQRKIDDMQKALEVKKQKAADAAKKAEEAKQASDKEAEIKKQEELKEQQQKAAEQEKLAAKAAKIKELERLQKEIDELDNGKATESSKPTSTITTKPTTTTNNKQTSAQKTNSIVDETPKKSTNNKNTLPTKIMVDEEPLTSSKQTSIKKNNSITEETPIKEDKKKEVIVEEEEEEEVTQESEYEITKFKPNNSNTNIPELEYASRPYYLDGNTLVRLERTEAIFVIKQKGIYRGTDRFINAMKQASTIQFKLGNLPRLFIKLEDVKIDPYDVITLCTADCKKDRRTFIYRSQKLSGKVNDVTDKLVSLDFKKIREGVYEIILPDDLPVGEYGFIPIIAEGTIGVATTNSIKINCFGVAP